MQSPRAKSPEKIGELPFPLNKSFVKKNTEMQIGVADTKFEFANLKWNHIQISPI